MKPQWLVFDFYGVFTSDTTAAYINSFHDASIQRKIRNLNREKDLGKLSLELYLKRITAIPQADRKKVAYLENSSRQYNYKLVEQVAAWSATYKIAVASNSYAPSLSKALQITGLDKYTSKVMSSSELGVVKPDIRFWKILVEKLQTSPSDILLIDDRLENVKSAQLFGLCALQYSGLDELCKFIGKASSEVD